MNNRQILSLTWCVCFAFVACQEPAGARLPMVNLDASSAELGSLALSASGGEASGHADVHGTEVQNVKDETYSFTAVPTGAAPLAAGQVEVHLLRFTGEEVFVHAEVTCLSIVGNDAWIGSRISRFVQNRQEVPERTGRPMIFRARDVGEGEGAVDLASLVFFLAPGGDELAHCNTRPDFPILRESVTGNIQVKN